MIPHMLRRAAYARGCMTGKAHAAVCSLAAVCALAAIAIPVGAAYAQANAQVVPTDKGTLDIDFALDPIEVSAGEPARMKIDFVDADTGRIQAHIDYEITVSADGVGAPVKSIPLTHTSSGSVTIPIEFESNGPHTVQMGVRGILFQPIPLETASLGLTIGGAGGGGAERAGYGADEVEGPIPGWVRAIFAYYADGALSDAELLAAIQYLADQGVIQIAPPSAAGGAAPQPPSMSDDAEWAADEADFADAVAERLRDDMQAFRVDLRVGGYVPGEPEDYEDAIEAGLAEIRAVESYAGVLRSASADGRITAAEDAAIKDAGRAADEAEAAAYEAIMATPLAAFLELSDGMMDMFAGEAGLGVPAEPAQPAAQRRITTAAEAADEADYLSDLAKDRRKHLRNFELGMAGSDYRTTGDFGSAGSAAAHAADGRIAVYNPMIDAIRDAIRAGERLAGILEDAARDGKISAVEVGAIADAEDAAGEAGRAAAAAYDATRYAQEYQGGVFAAFMNGFR